MAKLNLRLEINKETENQILEDIQNYIFMYNLMCQYSSIDVKPIYSEICDNNDGTLEFRIIDFEFDLDNIAEMGQEVMSTFINNSGIDPNTLL